MDWQMLSFFSFLKKSKHITMLRFDTAEWWMNCVLILVSITVCVHELVHNFFKCHYENFLLHCTARLKFFFEILQKIEVLESLESFRKEGDQYKVGS